MCFWSYSVRNSYAEFNGLLGGVLTLFHQVSVLDSGFRV